MKNQKVILSSLLVLAIAITAACGGGQPTFHNLTLLSSREGTTNLYISKLDGSNLSPVTNGPASAWAPSISASGKKIVFVLSGNVQIINSDGSGSTQLTTYDTESFWTYEPKISPDGKEVLFSLWDSSNDNYTIWVMKADGSGKMNLTPTLPEGMIGCYAGNFSSDLKNIVFSCYGNSTYAIYTAKSDGTNVKPVQSTDTGWYDTPMFSSDDKKIVFEGINIMSAGVRSNAASSQGPKSHRPNFSAQSKLNPRGISGNRALYSVGLDGSGLTPLVPDAYEGVIMNSTLYYTLPDGSVNLQVWKAASDGSGAVKVSDGTAQDMLGITYQFD